MILVTGGAGFIGSNFILDWLEHEQTPIINLDKLTYAGNLENLATIATQENAHIKLSIQSGEAGRLLTEVPIDQNSLYCTGSRASLGCCLAWRRGASGAWASFADTSIRATVRTQSES